MRIIGIDPGSRFTGYGVLEGEGSRLRHVDNGVIPLSGSLSLPERLKIIYRELSLIIAQAQPSCMAVEDVFLAKNAKSALKLGQARGAAILAGVNADLPVFEYSALQVKLAVVGYGRAGKDQVMDMIRHFFRLHAPLNPNAADALAVALCHLNTASSTSRWKESARP
ncbi:MAG: crossover junction endodeoxyribonuclease RuvC [Syntrophobacteraceae bacterium]